MNLTELRNVCLGKNIDNYLLEKVDIISPYISEGFFNSLIEELYPFEVFIVTDISCSSDALHRVKEVLTKKKIESNIKFAQCEGIVHAKCYLFHWRNKNTNRFKRLLLWGSCNATDGGFDRNTEIFSWLLLYKLDQKEAIIKYFNKARTDEFIDKLLIKHGNLTLLLPRINFCEIDSIDTFDLWIQRGRLCHQFQPDPSFRHLKVVLRNQIVPNDALSEALQEGAIDINHQSTISYDYIRQNSVEQEQDYDFTAKWRSKFFIDTTYGFWTSEHCFNQNKNLFYRRDYRIRRNEIDIISNADEQQRDKWCDQFLEKLESISTKIKNASEYFHCIKGQFDAKRYKEQFDKHLGRDFIYSKDLWFKNAYISGYDFPDVPPIRKFHTNWEEFIQSFAASLFFEINNKPKTQNLLAKTIRQFEIEADDSNEFLEELRSGWKDYENFRNALKNFHESNKE